jgi:hypothetical protein
MNHSPGWNNRKLNHGSVGRSFRNDLSITNEDPHPEEDCRYVEVNAEIDRLSRNDFKRGRLYSQARDERLLGPYASFKDYVAGRHRITERQAFYLMDAWQVFELLEEHGCKLLPTYERQCRPLKYLKRDDLKVLAWTRACALKQHGSAPDGNDVWREVRRLLGAIPDEESDKAYRAYRKLLESAASRYRKAHQLLEDGELEGFLTADDKRSLRQRKRLLGMLEKLAAILEEDALKLQGIEEDAVHSPCQQLWTRDVPARRQHFLLPYGLPITSFIDVLPDYLGLAP